MSTLLQVSPEKPAVRRRIRRSRMLGTVGLTCGSLVLIVAVVHSLWGPFSPQPSLAQRVVGVVQSMSDALVPDTVGSLTPERRISTPFEFDLIIKRVVVLLSVVGMLIAILAYSGGASVRVVGGALLLNGLAFGLYHILLMIALLVFVAVVVVLLGSSIY